MQVRVILHNFQQTSHAELLFTEGLSIIRGLNNNGKSSLIRAINAVVFNNPRKTKNYIKNGTTYCTVEIEVEGYKKIFWKKTSKEVIYQIGDSAPIEKAGRLCLKDVYPEHPFTVYEDSLLFNVIAQKSRPIPFGQTSSQVFAIFEELYGILSTKEDMAKFTTQASNYNNQLLQNKQQLEILHNKEVAFKHFRDAVDIAKLNQLKVKLQKMQKLLQAIQSIKELKKLTSQYLVTQIPITLKEIEDTISILKKIKEIKSTKSLLESTSKIEIPVDSEVFNLFKKLNTIKTIIQKINSINKQRTSTLDKIKNLKGTLPICPTCKRPF